MSLIEPQPKFTDDNEPLCQAKCHYFDPSDGACSITGDKPGDKCGPELVHLRTNKGRKPVDPSGMVDFLAGKLASIDATFSRESDAGEERDRALGERMGSVERRLAAVESRVVKMDEHADDRHIALSKTLRETGEALRGLSARLNKSSRDSQNTLEQHARADKEQDEKIDLLKKAIDEVKKASSVAHQASASATEASASASEASALASHASARTESAALTVETQALKTVKLANDLADMIPSKNRRIAQTLGVVFAVLLTMATTAAEIYRAATGK